MDQYLFSGLKVIDCATVIAAPAAAMILADFGANVIKIEQPGEGDMLRILSEVSTTPTADSAWFWQLDGHNKRSIALDLKCEEGQDVLKRLVRGCDVFITNHPYPVREALGLCYEDIRTLNPGVIYASLTAYGEQGPERDRKGFDQLAYWARSGLMELMREPDTVPAQGLPGMGDHPTGVALYAGIVTALLKRERTGEGAKVHTSLLANGLWSASGIAQGALAGGDMQAYREINRVNPAMGRVYRTRDDRWLQFNMVRNEELLSLALVALEATHLLVDERFTTLEDMWTHRQALGDELQAIISRKTSAEWMAEFAEHEVPVNLVANVEDTCTDAQILANAMAVPGGATGLPLIVKHPINVSSVPQAELKRAPELGEHGAEIAREFGYSD
ncbi:MAG: CoA transferase [Pseudomonadales bacterium]|nr:CoA transferase [Pseudomonadales bacterium]MDP6469414.1 CoA transferase [Pseudomonadales bacterium]MDP6827256.1 CoA transferase [Pseudomonadales bacterium]MDP6970444.1 CoA transferase [Pseudomonadales bacterium]